MAQEFHQVKMFFKKELFSSFLFNKVLRVVIGSDIEKAERKGICHIIFAKSYNHCKLTDGQEGQ